MASGHQRRPPIHQAIATNRGSSCSVVRGRRCLGVRRCPYRHSCDRPHARHLARVDEYVYKPEVDPSKKSAYAMVIGLHPGAALRAIGEVDYENARIIAGRSFRPQDENASVAVVGRLYAYQRLGIGEPPAISPGAAIANAVANACGIRVPELPLTPDRVLAALAQKGAVA